MSQVNKEFQGENDFTEMDRREFMKHLGLLGSMGLLAACSQKADRIVPFSREIKEFSQRNYEFYSSVISSRGFGQGILVKSYQGRPVKIEGNPLHPFSLGATTSTAQSSLYDLYHPERLKEMVWKGKKHNIADLGKKIAEETIDWGKGEERWFLFPAKHSPTTHALIKDLQRKWPESKWTSLSPWKKTEYLQTTLKEVDLVVTFDEDIFYGRPDALKLSREFMARRKKAIESNDEKALNSLIAFSSSPQLVTAKADEKHIQKREEIWNFAVDLHRCLKTGSYGDPHVRRLAAKLKSRKSIVYVSHDLHPKAAELEKDFHHLLRQDSKANTFELPENASAEEFEKALIHGKVKTLVLLETNLLLTRPEWKKLFEKIPHTITFSLWNNDTTSLSHTAIAASHFLEYWSDLANVDGTISIQQPLIRPVFHSLSLPSFLSLFRGEEKDSYEIIKGVYEKLEDHLKTGNVIRKNKREKDISLSTAQNFESLLVPENFRIKVVPDYSLGYGENPLNPLMLELPKIYSRVVWNNTYFMSQEDADELGIKPHDVIEIKTKSVTAKGPVVILPYIAKKTIVATLGYGEKRGTNNYPFRSGDEIKVKKTWLKKKLALWQDDLSAHGRSPIKTDTLPLRPLSHEPILGLYPEHPVPVQEKGPQWGMTIDLTTCIGCQACVIACQVENNVPFVGEYEARRGRMMHWLRVDTYKVHEDIFFQPVPCMHCEKAPCEVVCPVNATLHGNGGLNEMVYNRCVGTRYCSNNCPYRVRRFNFKAYASLKHPYNLGFNPEVSVRDRGVMEKCTYCIQRIREGESKNETSKVISACAQVCPTEAIKFGDISDQKLAVSQEKKGPRNYDLLEEEGTVPRTSYLKVIRNPHA